mmetsp:Transcript_74742/g.207824  ORF Transcript_74742/g.207824 Transcript_74742/m.207824 type:complete len:243 (-) Transcript_74742:395-1123(-)
MPLNVNDTRWSIREGRSTSASSAPPPLPTLALPPLALPLPLPPGRPVPPESPSSTPSPPLRALLLPPALERQPCPIASSTSAADPTSRPEAIRFGVVPQCTLLPTEEETEPTTVELLAASPTPSAPSCCWMYGSSWRWPKLALDAAGVSSRGDAVDEKSDATEQSAAASDAVSRAEPTEHRVSCPSGADGCVPPESPSSTSANGVGGGGCGLAPLPPPKLSPEADGPVAAAGTTTVERRLPS